MSEVKEFLSDRKNRQWLIDLAKIFVKDPVESEELAHEVMEKMLLNEGKYQKDSNIKAWAYIITKNTFITRYNRKKQWRFQDISAQNNDGDEDHRHFLHGYSEENKGEKNILFKEIHKHLKALVPQQRILFELYLKGIKYQELSEIFEIPMGTVKNQIFTMKKYLLEEITKESAIPHDIITA
jgi:RNA polymerase sigma factor (sigma-70 family)